MQHLLVLHVIFIFIISSLLVFAMILILSTLKLFSFPPVMWRITLGCFCEVALLFVFSIVLQYFMTTNVISTHLNVTYAYFYLSQDISDSSFNLIFDSVAAQQFMLNFQTFVSGSKISPDTHVNFHSTVDIMDNWYGFRYHRWGRALLVFTSMDFPGLMSIHMLWRINTTALNWNVLQIFDGHLF